jgi:uncharacterized coiled-coil DUF342 family protein
MNALVVYTPTKDWTILWTMVGIAFLLCMLKADTENRMMEKMFRLMDKYADIAKSTDQELDKVTAELNEVNHELEKAMNDREEMKLETNKVNTMLLEALKLVYELDRKMTKTEIRVDAIGTLCKSQQEVPVQMGRKFAREYIIETKEVKMVRVDGPWRRNAPVSEYRKDVDAMV